MQYEIVNLKEKTVVGPSTRTSNSAADMSAKIGGLWHSFFEDGVYMAIPNKTTHTTIGLYSNYAGDEKGDYDMTVCCEVSSTDNLPQGVTVKTIPAGKYAKFIVTGDQVEAVMKFWTELWSMPLDRAFTADFEEYVSGGGEEPCEIHIYISLK